MRAAGSSGNAADLGGLRRLGAGGAGRGQFALFYAIFGVWRAYGIRPASVWHPSRHLRAGFWADL